MTFFYRYRKRILILLFSCVLLIGGGSFVVLSVFAETEEEKEEVIHLAKETEALKPKEKEQDQEEIMYKIDIKGEINHPGIYSLKKDCRVFDAISLAGGLTDNADTSVLNLSKKIKDEMVIIIYSREEVENFKQTKKQEEEIQNFCLLGGDKNLQNDACIKENQNTSEEKSQEKISINTASFEELQQLNGVGEAKAKAIVRYREEHGNFQTIEDLMNVSGIGESLFASIKENITV